MILTIVCLLFVQGVFSAVSNCKTQVGNNYCSECNDGYVLTVSIDSETNIPIMQCNEKGSITDMTCGEGQRLSAGGCVSCPTGCSSCNLTHCYQCGSGLTLSTDETKCVDCSKPENDEYCGKCAAGKYFNKDTKTCFLCIDNCALCTSGDNCYQCKNNKYLQKVNGKDQCVELTHCTDKKSDHCEQCEEGYRLEEGFCQSCGENCLTCYKAIEEDQEVVKCSQCVEGLIPSKGKCVNKNSINCEIGSSTHGCTQCKEGFFFNENLECQKCHETCGTCIGQADQCLSCPQDHYFSRDTASCKKMDNNCKIVDQAGCKECKNNLEDVKTSGYFVPPGGQVCEQCTDNCKLCDKVANNCTACLEGYLLTLFDEENNLHICEAIKDDDPCVNDQMGYCTECKEGYFIHSDGNTQGCAKCHESCASCKDETSCLTCDDKYYWRKGEEKKLCYSKTEITNVCEAGPNGCEKCKEGYWINPNNETMYNCSACESPCLTCHWNIETSNVVCDSCLDKNQYVKNGKCEKCTDLPNCLYCSGEKCVTCQDGYTLDAGSVSCSKTNWGLIIPIIVVVIVILVIIVIIFIAFIWWKRKQKIKDEAAAIKPFHVSSDLEMILLGADNEHFPLKTDKWELSFGLTKTKAVVDTEYEETVNLANMSKREYYFEFYITPSHKYDLQVTPKSATLKPGTAITATFKLKMLCTTTVSENVGISAMDVDDQEKETAKFTLIAESDLSMKLDHQELKPIMPPIGEGAFGMVFRGSYRGREVAIKKMKARNMTPEQEKEFNHEVSMMTQLRHNCVVELIGAVYTEGEISIVTEFAEYGSLSKIWKRHKLDFAMKVKVLDDMAVGLAYLHKNQILHRDVKGENLLVYSLNAHSPVCAKLTDFGTCRNISERNLSVKELTVGIGTPTYMAPESLQNSTDYSYPVDVYAFAIVMYETYIERNGYDSDERFGQPWLIPQFVIEGNRLDKPDNIPDNYWELITKCWQQNPEDRPSFTDILETIESWGEDIRYALHADGGHGGIGGASDVSSTSSASVPSSAQEPSVSVSESDRDSTVTGEDKSRSGSTVPPSGSVPLADQKEESSSTSSTSSSSDD